jgi:hypothetical protein
MHAFQPESFAVLSPAKAKAAALALFDSAMVEPAPDWRGVAFALHSVVTRKRGAAVGPALDEIAMGDAADASEFIAWADYSATGKAANIARGRVTVTFADGWSKTVGMLAGKTAKGRKPWSIAHAVRFAVICYKIAAVRRATGSDGAIYFDKGGMQSGETITLDGLICAPEIVSVISAESAETVEGDLIWNPDDANAFTLDQRAGLVHIPLALAPMPADIADALREARQGLLGRMGLIRSPMYVLAKEAAARGVALLFPNGFETRRSSACEALFSLVWGDDRDAYPMDDAESVARMERIAAADAAEFPAEATADDEIAADCPEPAAPVDHETMLLASEIVGASRPTLSQIVGVVGRSEYFDAYSAWLAGVSHIQRFNMVEDALIAWPALEEIATDAPEPHSEPLATVEPEADPATAQTPAARPYSISEARYAKGQMVIDCPCPTGYKTRAAYLAEEIGGRYVGRSKGYHVSRRQAEQFERLYAAGENQEADTTVAAPVAAAEPPKPAAKPRYRYSPVSGSWEIVPPVGTVEIERIAA